MTVSCDHQYTYGGMRFCDGAWAIPGSGARHRYYAHVYYCTKCTECKGQPAAKWTTYDKIQFEATPGTPSQCGVPLEDQR